MARRGTSLTRFGTLLCLSIASLVFCPSIMAQQTAPTGSAVPADSATAALHKKTVALIEARCAECHGGKRPRMGLDLRPERLVEAVKDIPSRQIDSLKLVDTRMPEKSYFLMKVRGDKGIKGSRMPDNLPALSAGEIKTVDLWIHGMSMPRRGSRTAPSAADSTRKE